MKACPSFIDMKNKMIGEPFPEFELEADDNSVITHNDLLDYWSVLFFYPKDNSYGCTIESCTFRDEFERFEKLNTQIFGLSSDSTHVHQKFKKRQNLNYLLLSDIKGKLRKKLGIKKTLGLIDGRATFIVDQKGIVKHVINSQIAFKRHVFEAAKFIEKATKGE